MTKPGQSAEELFGEALALPPEHRPAFLDRACPNPEVRSLVDHLLQEDQRAGSFLAAPAFAPDGAAWQPETASTTRSSAAPGRFQPAQLVANRFVIVRFIARGGMGDVYEAKDQFLQHAGVALKMIRPEIASDGTTSARFEQEVLLARKVTHPNLCPIYEIFHCEEPQPSFLFLTMKLLRGETLYARLRESSKLDPNHAVGICNQLLDGVAALHAGGIIHRDLKPNNVMLEPERDRRNCFAESGRRKHRPLCPGHRVARSAYGRAPRRTAEGARGYSIAVVALGTSPCSARSIR